MVYAPLSFMRQRLLRRTTTAHLKELSFLDFDGQKSFSINFFDRAKPNSPHSVQRFPPNSQGETSLFNPPGHYHLVQDEYFEVISGQGLWHLWDDTVVVLNTGEKYQVPARKYHWFQNNSNREPLIVGYWYDKEHPKMEEIFFRNTLSYMADCRNAGVPPSIFQVALFGLENLMVFGVIHSKFIPTFVEVMINTILCVLLACVGRYLLGYEKSYEEYYKLATD